MLSSQAPNRDPLSAALRRKAQTGAPGAAEARALAAGEGWRVTDIVCTSGPRDDAFEEQHSWASISLVLRGIFVYRSLRDSALMAPGAMLLGSPGSTFVCSHQHGEGDRCISFQYHPELFEEFARETGAPRQAFAAAYLPPLRALAPLAARVASAAEKDDSFEEIALELADSVIQTVSPARAIAAARDPAAIARVLSELESRSAQPLGLREMAAVAGLSQFHFLRTFRNTTGVTPHQWLLRARLRDAARRLATSREPVTEIALDVGFEDLSNFIRSFRAEFGLSPSRYRALA